MVHPVVYPSEGDTLWYTLWYTRLREIHPMVHPWYTPSERETSAQRGPCSPCLVEKPLRRVVPLSLFNVGTRRRVLFMSQDPFHCWAIHSYVTDSHILASYEGLGGPVKEVWQPCRSPVSLLDDEKPGLFPEEEKEAYPLV